MADAFRVTKNGSQCLVIGINSSKIYIRVQRGISNKTKYTLLGMNLGNI